MRIKYDTKYDVYDVEDDHGTRLATYAKMGFALHHLNTGHAYLWGEPPCCAGVDPRTGSVLLPVRPVHE